MEVKEDIDMITEFGKCLRNIRMDCNELLKDMAEKLNMTSAYLSAIEHGKREIPEGCIGKIIRLYNLNVEEFIALEEAAANSRLSLKIDLFGHSDDKKSLANAFARKFENLDEAQINEMMNILKK